jgi:hypothetical protein
MGISLVHETTWNDKGANRARDVRFSQATRHNHWQEIPTNQSLYPN